MLKRIMKHVDMKSLKEDIRKVGVNFITAGVVGVFINHFVGTKSFIMFVTSSWITTFGVVVLLCGLYRRID